MAPLDGCRISSPLWRLAARDRHHGAGDELGDVDRPTTELVHPPDRCALLRSAPRSFRRHDGSATSRRCAAGAACKPYIYTYAEITALLAAALSLPPANALRRWRCHCRFGLIRSPGYAIPKRSTCAETTSISTKVSSPFGRQSSASRGWSRSMPRRSPDYAARGDAHLVAPRNPYFFVAQQGGRLLHQYVHRVFWQLSRQIDLPQRGQRNGPRIHDLRHRSAVQALTNWYRVSEMSSGNCRSSRPFLAPPMFATLTGIYPSRRS
ncbi:hypothetical protein [Mesorhizobium loti]|uniref:hypothetical protein n=1 Tax=Rhizobium loti TaxID=381 RepID=UPI003D7C2E6E